MMEENDVYDSIGSMSITEFESEDEIRDYFTTVNFIDMFNECTYPEGEMEDLCALAVRMWYSEKYPNIK